MNTKSKMFSNWSEVTSGERNEIVFERLNKTYGAYEIRTNYDNTLAKAFSATIIFIIFFSGLTFISKSKPISIPIPKTKDSLIFVPPPHRTYSPPKGLQPQPPVQSNSKLAPEVKKDSIEKIDTTTFASANTNSNNNGEKGNKEPENNPVGSGEKGKENSSEKKDSVYDYLDGDQPTFPGGDNALFAFLQKNISYPQEIKEIGGKGIVGISFIIDKEGNVTDVNVLKKTKFFQLDNEALRVVKKLPKWFPGKQQGRPVRVRMILPIRFEVK